MSCNASYPAAVHGRPSHKRKNLAPIATGLDLIVDTAAVQHRTGCICLEQCFPTSAPWSPCAPRCIAKGSVGDDITNKLKKRNWGPLDRHNEIDRTNEYTYNNITMITMYNAHV